MAVRAFSQIGSDSWSKSYIDLGEAEDSSSSGSESSASSSSESSHEFVVDDNYMIVTKEASFDEMSDIQDSVISNRSSGSRIVNSQPRCTASQRNLQLAAISEEEESDPCEAYLRAKMTALWTRIQETALKEDLSATPSTNQDAELLHAYERKNNTLTLLGQRP